MLSAVSWVIFMLSAIVSKGVTFMSLVGGDFHSLVGGDFHIVSKGSHRGLHGQEPRASGDSREEVLKQGVRVRV